MEKPAITRDMTRDIPRDMTRAIPPAMLPATSPAPWWRHGHVWLVLAGPVVVIIAGFITLWLALRTPDALVADDYYRRGIEINRALESRERAHMPALQGRNHAATPDAAAAPAR